MLSFLAENDYRTLTADEYLMGVGAADGPPRREVMLTFDDGHVSLHRSAFPALRRLGLKAVAYVVPGRIPEPGGEGAGTRLLCDWGEIAEMHASGVIDFQSHSFLHHSIAVASRIVDFARPGLPLSFLDSDLAPVAAETAAAPAWGAPIHDWGARLSARAAWRERPEVERACTDEVARNGGAEYFREPDWRDRLQTVAREARRSSGAGSHESDAEQRAAVLADLVAAKQAIERRLAGKRVRHLCYPWYRGSVLAARLAREAGMLTEAWGSVVPAFAGSADMPLPIRRLPPQLLWRLPGKGRRPLLSVLRSRWSRTLAGGRADA
jgi:peptidoglycan/xylan/chitin deacetylase (PgdA/CDA1 family)